MVRGELMTAHVEHERCSWDGVEMELRWNWDNTEMKLWGGGGWEKHWGKR